jgi:hypothetical protein
MTQNAFGYTYRNDHLSHYSGQVDLSDLSHSNPFLHLSRKFNVPYSTILLLADMIDKDQVTQVTLSNLTSWAQAVWAVCHAQWRWDISRTGERGLWC